MPDFESMAGEVIAAVKDYVGRSVAGMNDRLDEFDQRLKRFALPVPEKGEKGDKGDSGVDGKDGASGERGEKGDSVEGAPGRDGLPGLAGRDGAAGADGKDGVNGKDGLGFDDMTAEYDGERTFSLKFQRGEEVKAFSFKLPITIDRGVYRPEKAYERGDGVTYGGSFHIAQKDAPDGRPGFGGDWRLAVKRGQDGKDGTMQKAEAPQVVRIK